MTDRIEAGSVVLDRLPKPVVSELGPWLRRHQTHVIHFVGHGDFDERLREGVIYFQNKSGASAPVTSSVLGPYVRDHDPLRMVVLNACRSARTDAVDPFGGIAQGLVQQDATAVVAMQFPISDRAAVAFTGDFYGSLVDGLPVDQAVTSARKALLGEFRDEWATPVLFLRAPDGEIFEGVHAPTRTTPATAAAPLTDPRVRDGHARLAAPSTPTGPPPSGPDSASGPRHRGWPPTAPGRRRRRSRRGPRRGRVIVALNNGDGDPDSGTTTQPSLSESATSQPPTTPAGQATAVLPVAAVPLTPDQLLIAAGPRDDNLNIYRVDLAAGTATAVTVGDGRKAGPSIGGERDTLIFSERIPDTANFRLRTVDPATGESDGVLLEGVPAACAQSMERPARSPGGLQHHHLALQERVGPLQPGRAEPRDRRLPHPRQLLGAAGRPDHLPGRRHGRLLDQRQQQLDGREPLQPGPDRPRGRARAVHLRRLGGQRRDLLPDRRHGGLPTPHHRHELRPVHPLDRELRTGDRCWWGAAPSTRTRRTPRTGRASRSSAGRRRRGPAPSSST